MEKCNDCTLELSALLDSDWRKALPKNYFTNIRCNKERDPAAKSVTLLDKFI
jgi:hypothetical protein